MKKNYLLISQTIFISISIIFWLFLLGPKYINPLSQDWLYNGDLSIYQLGWKFFRDDLWRFPLGLNPNYGIYNGGSIIFSDSIPILAFIFKFFESFIPDTFQYFSFWILLCIYLQIYLSYKIIFFYSENFYYSCISSFFFLISTIFLHRSGIHLSLMGHWLILLYFLINISKKNNFKDNKKKLLILFSSLIHFYFTIILTIIYFIETIFSLRLKIKFIINLLIKNLAFLIFLFLSMYVIGYFSIKIDDGLGGGYGSYSFNLNSFFNPLGFNNITGFSWSFFLKNVEFKNFNPEGFSYLGISGLLFFALCLNNYRTGKYEIIFNRKISITIFIFLTLIATSNNISFGEHNLLNINLNKYIYLLLSSVRASGRLIWPVFYIIFFSGILYICFTQNKKRANIIITVLFILQLIDLFPGLMNYKFGKQYTQKIGQFVENEDWVGLSNNFTVLRNLNPENQSELYYELAKHIMSENYHKTDISYLARINRQTLETVRVKIVEKNKERAEYLASQLNDTIVINGDGLDEEVLAEANMEESETVLALTNDDEDNLMVSVLVEKFTKDQKDIEEKRTMALVNKPNYALLQSSLKIDDLIDPRMSTVSSILKHVHKGTIENAYTVSNGEFEIIEAEVIETSELINKELKNSNLPDELRIGAILRDDKVIIPRSDFIFKKDDRVVFIVKKDTIPFVENIFRLSSV